MFLLHVSQSSLLHTLYFDSRNSFKIAWKVGSFSFVLMSKEKFFGGRKRMHFLFLVVQSMHLMENTLVDVPRL